LGYRKRAGRSVHVLRWRVDELPEEALTQLLDAGLCVVNGASPSMCCTSTTWMAALS